MIHPLGFWWFHTPEKRSVAKRVVTGTSKRRQRRASSTAELPCWTGEKICVTCWVKLWMRRGRSIQLGTTDVTDMSLLGTRMYEKCLTPQTTFVLPEYPLCPFTSIVLWFFWKLSYYHVYIYIYHIYIYISYIYIYHIYIYMYTQSY